MKLQCIVEDSTVTLIKEKRKIVFDLNDFHRLLNCGGQYTTKFKKEQWIASVEWIKKHTDKKIVLTRKNEKDFIFFKSQLQVF